MTPEMLRSMKHEMQKEAVSFKPMMGMAQRAAGGLRRGANIFGRNLKEYGQRQVHGFTGAYKGSVTAGSERAVARAQKAVQAATDSKARQAAEKGLESATRTLARQQRAIDSGITTIPGLAKNLATRPGSTLKALGDNATGGSARGTALMLGVPAAIAAPGLMKGDESDQGGPTMTRKLVNAGTMVGASALTGGLSTIPGLLAYGATEGGVNSLYNAVTNRRMPNKGIAGRYAAIRAGQQLARTAAGSNQ